ncbi:MAG TPA: DedA family protein [Candidatus Paceibacterota bacterium]
MIISLQGALQLLLTYKYAILFPIAIIEGPIISIIAGFLISSGHLNLYIVFGLLVLGDLIGDTIYYGIGRFGGNYFLKRWGWLLNIDSQKLLKLEKRFENHGGKLLFFAKAQGIGGAILAAAGVIKMPYARFMWLNAVATLIKSVILIMIGYYFGKAYSTINDYFNKIAIISTLLLVIVIIIYFLRRQKIYE